MILLGTHENVIQVCIYVYDIPHWQRDVVHDVLETIRYTKDTASKMIRFTAIWFDAVWLIQCDTVQQRLWCNSSMWHRDSGQWIIPSLIIRNEKELPCPKGIWIPHLESLWDAEKWSGSSCQDRSWRPGPEDQRNAGLPASCDTPRWNPDWDLKPRLRSSLTRPCSCSRSALTESPPSHPTDTGIIRTNMYRTQDLWITCQVQRKSPGRRACALLPGWRTLVCSFLYHE